MEYASPGRKEMPPSKTGSAVLHVVKIAAVLIALGSPLATLAQDLSTFLAKPPKPGAWAAYRIETSSPGRVKRERFNLAVTDQEQLGGQNYVWLEAGPTNFAGFKDGYLRILIKTDPLPEEALNPFLETMALAYQEPGEEPFRLSGGALTFMHSQAKDIKVKQDRKDLGPGKATSVKGVSYDCTRTEITTTTESSFLGRSYTSTETGTYWFSTQTPFLLVRAEIERVEVNGKKTRRKTVVVQLKEASYEGAASHFTAPARKEKGLLGILFH
jgi:hypothetical protein